MTARRLAKVFLSVVLASAGGYVFVYLSRWEWNRAVLAGVFFVAAEVAIAATVLLERMGRIERGLDRVTPGAAPRTDGSPPPALARIQEASPPPPDPFAWLRPRPDRFGVFVPILMGVGVIASALAWVVERLARATAGPALERGLAERLRPLAWPERPLDQADEDVRSLLSGPRVASGS